MGKLTEKIRSLTLTAFLVSGIVQTTCLSTSSYAAGPRQVIDRMPIMNPKFFKGVDTLIVSEIFGTEANKVLNLTHIDTGPVILEEVQKIFADADQHLPVSWVAIKPLTQSHQMMEIKDLEQPNVMQLFFVLSARQEKINGQIIKVADLRMSLGKRSTRQNGGDDTSYPFVVPDSKEELQERIRDGVFYLTSKLPNYFACGNKYGRTTPQCPDCNLRVCSFYETWEERR
jgi:hypothetical protein